LKLSIIIAVLNSHEVVRRQIEYFKKMNLPDDTEIILVDDGSDPPLSAPDCKLRNFAIYATGDTRPWTQPIARNKGARLAKGERLLFTDIDHILSQDLINTVKTTPFRFLRFQREFGVLLEDGTFTQDIDTLKTYGFPVKRLVTRGLRLPVHSNSFSITKDLFWRIGGMPEDRITYPNREEAVVRKKINQLVRAGKIRRYNDNDRPTIYMFPNGGYCGDADFNPFGLFHNLNRKT